MMNSVWPEQWLLKTLAPRLWSLLLTALQLQSCFSAEFTLGMDSETSCSKTHYYEKGDIFTASANGKVHAGTCPLTFIQGTAWRNDREAEPCHSLCIRILSYTMESCYVEMAYHDGLNDFTPVTFNCHTFPPVMWCSSKTDLKLTVSELKNYQGKNYAITLEVKPFCGKFDLQTTDSSVIVKPQSKPPMNQTVVIIGAIVGTISILFVCGWLLYCFKKRQSERHSSNDNRNPQGRPANQQGTRYAPANRNPPSSQSSSDRVPYRPPPEIFHPVDNVPNIGQDRHLYSPFQPPVTTKTMPFSSNHVQQPFYSDFNRGQGGGNTWYPMTPLGPSQTEPDSPVKFSLPADPVTPYNPQQVYKYPQFNQDSEMHTAPTDTRYVVYDFDYSRPMERKYSAGKTRTSPHRDSPVKDISNYPQRPREITPPTDFSQRPREITPLRETVRVMHPDTTTTDHTSDNESSFTDSSDYGTDDQFIPTRPYHINTQHAMQNRQNNPNLRYYDPTNFQRIDGARYLQQGKTEEPGSFKRINGYGLSDITNISDLSPELDRSNVYSSSPPKKVSPISYPDFTPPSKDGPAPQVPPMPKGFSCAQTPSSQVPIPQQISRTPVSQSQDPQVPSMQRKDSGPGPQVVPPRPQVTLESQIMPVGLQVVPSGLDKSGQERTVSQSSHTHSDSRPHTDSVEREVPWPQCGPPPYTEEQSDLV